MAGFLIPAVIGVSFVAGAFGLYQLRYTVTEVKEVITGENGILGSAIGKTLIVGISLLLLTKAIPSIKKVI